MRVRLIFARTLGVYVGHRSGAILIRIVRSRLPKEEQVGIYASVETRLVSFVNI